MIKLGSPGFQGFPNIIFNFTHHKFMRKIAISLIILLAACAKIDTHRSAETIDNIDIMSPYEAGQRERMEIFNTGEMTTEERKNAIEKMGSNDSIRRNTALRILRDGQLRTGADYWRAGFIFHHGPDLEDIRLAFSLATIATALDDKLEYRWLKAAAWDRILVWMKQPQWYGTQFEMDPESGQQIQSAVADGVVSDAERQELGVPTLKQSQEMLREINSRSVQENN